MLAEPSDGTGVVLPIYTEDHVKGPEWAQYTLLVYGDYECSACRQLFEILTKVEATLRERFRLVYRHHPLSGIHLHAQLAAEAAEAAGAQGRFWEMHYLLFQNQNALKHKNLLSYAKALRLNIDRFRSDLRSRIYRERVREDFRRGVQNNVFQPPAIFLNGVRHHDVATLRIALARIANSRAIAG